MAIIRFSILHFKIYNLLTSIEDLKTFFATSYSPCFFFFS